MKWYTHPKYNYVRVVEIKTDEVDKIDFATCKEPRETLGSFYNRQTVKPDVLVNAGFFTLANGQPVMNTIDEGVVRSKNANYKYGMGTTPANPAKLIMGSLDHNIKWKDFVTAYPVLLDGTGPITKFTYATEINYSAVRSCLGYNNDTIFVVHIGRPGMAFKAMSQMMYDLGATHAINLDGGGSARLLVKGSVVGKPTENRSVDNVLAIYLKPVKVEEDDDEAAVETPYITYKVKSGDSWWKIAQEQLGNGNRYKELMLFNGVTSTVLRVNQVLKIPVEEYTYSVKKGDSWWSIAQKELGNPYRYKELAEYNGKTPTSTLYVGQVLKIPV